MLGIIPYLATNVRQSDMIRMLTQTLIALRPVAELPGLAVEGLVSSQLQENGEEGVHS